MDDKVEFGYEPEFVEHATLSREGFEELVGSLMRVASQPANNLSDKQLRHLENEVEVLDYQPSELKAILDRLDRPIDRGDAFMYVLSIMEAAFYVGRYSINGDLIEARKKLGSIGGSASAKVRTAARAKWQSALLEVARTMQARSIDALTSKAIAALPPGAPNPPSHDAAADFLRQERRAGRFKLLRNSG